MQLLWNGSVANKFFPTRGVRQGDPISPYLFVLAIERLGHLIQSAVNDGDWYPFRLKKNGTAISHLFFADDLILFARADMEQAGVIKAILDDFCEISGFRVNTSKSHIYFSNNVNHTRRKEISEFLNFVPCSNLGKYLGMPILHERVSKSTYKFILDKMDARLSSWKANTLSFAGRHTLVSAVTSTMPSYAMQTTPLPSGICSEVDKRSRNFFWGSISPTRKIHLVSWNNVCRRKEEGGLGIRRAKIQNMAYMTKLGWSLITRRDLLWVQFLREKYKIGMDLIPKIEKRRSESRTWKGIRSNWNVVTEGLAWRVRNGRGTRFWKDAWVPHFDDLKSYATRSIPEDVLNWKVSDCVSASGSWEWHKFVDYFPPPILDAIAQVHVNAMNSNDLPVWRWSSNGVFTLKSAYEYLSGQSNNADTNFWRLIWKLKVPQRCRSFLWLCAHERLLTNITRFNRGLHTTGACEICKEEPETLLHALRDCTHHKLVWLSLVPSEWRDHFFGCTSIQTWLKWALHKNMSVDGFEFRLWFAVLCRFIWLSRNDQVFNSKGWTLEVLLARSRACLSWGTQKPLVAPAPVTAHFRWSPPPPHVVKVNIDGSRHRGTGCCTCGGIFRDHDGHFLQGFMYRVGAGSTLTAEAWGLLWALKLAWDRNLRKLVVESDCSELVQSVHSILPEEHPDFNVLLEIQRMLKRTWDVEVVYCAREANVVADALAAEAWNHAADLCILSSPPERVRELIQADMPSTRISAGYAM